MPKRQATDEATRAASWHKIRTTCESAGLPARPASLSARRTAPAGRNSQLYSDISLVCECIPSWLLYSLTSIVHKCSSLARWSTSSIRRLSFARWSTSSIRRLSFALRSQVLTSYARRFSIPSDALARWSTSSIRRLSFALRSQVLTSYARRFSIPSDALARWSTSSIRRLSFALWSTSSIRRLSFALCS
jgi:hypothetical protein